ncbi:aspartate--tRNA(Asn) ligase [Clostridium sediminicola]|uniref:aspartate--tRNA(Asn) ligase n=1 Tax=Clostridium sediminicola TaxID=3114879 RepID=UPI0031F1C7D3
MERIFVKDIKVTDKKIIVRGWIHNIVNLGKVNFIKLRDKTGIIQLVVEEDKIKGLRNEMSIEVSGTVEKNEKAPSGIEMQVDDLKVLGKTYYDVLPFAINRGKIKSKLDVQLDNRSISLRKPTKRAIFKIQEEIEEGFRTFLRSKSFSQIHSPKIIDSATEGGSEMFTVDFYNNRAFLAQSPQFYKQMMVGAGFERVYEVGHAYRAELHNTWRHLSEYVSLDVEMGFIKDEEELMDLEESMLSYIFTHLKDTCKEQLEMYNIELPSELKIPRITLKEAQDILLEKFSKQSPPGNLDGEGEKLFSKYVKDEYGCDFVFLTEYPISKRPMYTMPHESKEGVTRSFDLIYKGLEITTGGQRIHDYEMLLGNIKKFGLKPENFTFYTDTFKFGMPPHGGFAIGLERITMKILDLDNIREATLLPRDIKRLVP